MAKKACFKFGPVVAVVALLFFAMSRLPAGHSGEIEASKIDPVKKGKMAFVRASCWGCHAHGDNTLNQDKPLKGEAFLKRYPNDQKIRAFVRKGSVRRGMPAFGKERLSDSDLDSIIVFIRSLTPAK